MGQPTVEKTCTNKTNEQSLVLAFLKIGWNFQKYRKEGGVTRKWGGGIIQKLWRVNVKAQEIDKNARKGSNSRPNLSGLEKDRYAHPSLAARYNF